MESKYLPQAEQVLETAKQMTAIGLVSKTGSGGNVSVRIPQDDLAAITPSGIPYREMEVEDIVIIDLAGNVVEGIHQPSSETPFHTLLLRNLAGLGAAVHTHSPYATALSALRKSIPLTCNEGFMANAARIDVTPSYAIPGTEKLAEVALETFAKQPGCRAVLLANHGVLAVGETAQQALRVADNVEWEAKVYYLAISVGEPRTITPEMFRAIQDHYAASRGT